VKNLLLVVVDCARAEKTVVDVPQASPGTRRSAPLPGLDALRARGTTWTHYVAISSTTTPNFATMLTGLLPHEHGIREHSRHALRDVATLAGILRERGWHTRAEVTGPLIPETGLARGFGAYRWRDRGAYLDAGFGAELRSLVASLPSPWFLLVHLWEAHMPYRVPAAFAGARHGATAYDRALAALDHHLAAALAEVDPARTSIVWCGDHGERLVEDWVRIAELGGDDRPWQAWRRFAARTAPGGAPDLDAWFEHAAGALGPAAARIHAHNVLGHGFHLTEDLVRTPLVIVDPDRCAAGETRDELRSQLDLFPTLLDLAGLPAGERDIAARSILRAPAPDAVYVEANGSGGKQHAARCHLRGVRTARFKRWHLEAEGVAHETLWDLASDPRETRDVTAAFPAEAARLDARLAGWLAREPAGTTAGLATEDEARLVSTLRSLGYL